MQEISLSYSSRQASVTTLNVVSEQSRVNVALQGNEKTNILNNQENQIVDEVDLTQAALQQLEDAKILADKLQNYLDYLYGRSDQSNVQIVSPNSEPKAIISGESTKLSASITVASYKEETLDVAARFDDDGNLTDLSIKKTSITAEYVSAELSIENSKFFAAIS